METLVKSSDRYEIGDKTDYGTVPLRQKGGASLWQLTRLQCEYQTNDAARRMVNAAERNDMVSFQHWRDEFAFWQAALDAFGDTDESDKE